MASQRRNRTRRPARGRQKRSQYKRILIVCEGAVTEKEYIEGLKRHLNNRAIQIRVCHKYSDPKPIVAYAVKQRERLGEFDETWCIFDHDGRPEFSEACKMAVKKGLELGVSSPSFEFWLLLHFQDCQTTGLTQRSVQKLLKQHIGDYDKHIDFDTFSPGLAAACQRAERSSFDVTASTSRENRPSTSMHRLVVSMQAG